MRSKESIGIIGLGHIGKYYIKAIREFPDLELIAVCDRFSRLSSVVPQGIRFYVDYHRMLQEEDIGTVIIATPNDTHYLVAREVLGAGRNIMLEKPAASTMKEVEELESAAAKARLAIYYVFHAACAFDVRWFAEYYNEPANRNELGPITGFSSRFYDAYIVKGRLLPAAEGLQNCWLDSGINALSVLQRFIDFAGMTIENVSTAVDYDRRPSILQCHAEFSFSINGRDRAGIGVIDTNWTGNRDYKSTAFSFGTTGNHLTIDHTAQKLRRRYPDGSEVELADVSCGRNRLFNHYLGVFNDYLEHVRSGNMNGLEATAAHRLLFDTSNAVNRTL